MGINWESKVLSSMGNVIDNAQHISISEKQIEIVADWLAYEEFGLPKNNKTNKNAPKIASKSNNKDTVNMNINNPKDTEDSNNPKDKNAKKIIVREKCSGINKSGEPCNRPGTEKPDGSSKCFCFRHAMDWKLYEVSSDSDLEEETFLDPNSPEIQ